MNNIESLLGDLVAQLKRVADHMEGNRPEITGMRPSLVVLDELEPHGQVPPSPYTSPDCPRGFDTVWAFYAKEFPEAFALLPEPITGLMQDAFWLRQQAHQRQLEIHRVLAPDALRSAGIDEVTAFPLPLLRERFNTY